MREKKYHLYLTADEQSKVIQSLIDLKNNLIAQGRYTDAVDDVLLKEWSSVSELAATTGKSRNHYADRYGGLRRS